MLVFSRRGARPEEEARFNRGQRDRSRQQRDGSRHQECANVPERFYDGKCAERDAEEEKEGKPC